MKVLEKLFNRVVQKSLYLVAPVLKWREPKLIESSTGLEGLADFALEKGWKSILVVYGGVIKKLQICQPMLEKLEKLNIKYAVFDQVETNPTIANVEMGVEIYKNNNCCAIIVVGGGSSIDCAKIIGARIVCPNKNVQNMKGLLKINKTLPPIVAIPTTAGTGTETTIAGVIRNEKNGEKYAISDPSLIPHYCMLDPYLTVSMPQTITAYSGMDALTHAVECYTNKSNTFATKNNALRAVELVFHNLPQAYENGENIDARKQMLMASYSAGLAFTRGYVGNIHALAHAIGGRYNLSHGKLCAIILPQMLRYYGNTVTRKLSQLAFFAGVADPKQSKKYNAQLFINAVENLNKSLNIPCYIDELKKEDIPQLAMYAYKEANPLYPVPKMLSKSEFEDIMYSLCNNNCENK